MPDLLSMFHLTHEQDLSIKAIAQWLRTILVWYTPVNPAGGSQIQNIVDVFVSKLSLNAGEGMVNIAVTGIGEAYVAVVDGGIWIAMLPDLPPDKALPEPVAVFVTDGRDVITCDLEGLAFAEQVLQAVDLQHQQYSEICQLKTWWNAKNDLWPNDICVPQKDAAIKIEVPARGLCT